VGSEMCIRDRVSPLLCPAFQMVLHNSFDHYKKKNKH
jgi:hypothetical protein